MEGDFCEIGSVPLPNATWFTDVVALFQQSYGEVHPYVATMLCVVGTLMNITTVIVLTRPSMVSPVNVLLCAVAICDILVMTSNLIFVVHFHFVAERRCVVEDFSYGWAVFTIVHAHVSVIFHATSIWLTVSLAQIRVLTIRRATAGPTTNITERFSVILSVVTLIIMAAVNLPNFMTFEIDEVPAEMYLTCLQVEELDDTVSTLSPTTGAAPTSSSTPLPLNGTMAYGVRAHEKDCMKLKMAFWSNGMIFKVVPCLLLTVSIVALLKIIADVSNKRKNLAQVMKKKVPKDHTTPMLAAVLSIFLIAELPQGVMLVMTGIFSAETFKKKIYLPLGDFMDFLSLLNSAIGFFIYVGMSRKFRSVFFQLFFSVLHCSPYYGDEETFPPEPELSETLQLLDAQQQQQLAAQLRKSQPRVLPAAARLYHFGCDCLFSMCYCCCSAQSRRLRRQQRSMSMRYSQRSRGGVSAMRKQSARYPRNVPVIIAAATGTSVTELTKRNGSNFVADHSAIVAGFGPIRAGGSERADPKKKRICKRQSLYQTSPERITIPERAGSMLRPTLGANLLAEGRARSRSETVSDLQRPNQLYGSEVPQVGVHRSAFGNSIDGRHHFPLIRDPDEEAILELADVATTLSELYPNECFDPNEDLDLEAESDKSEDSHRKADSHQLSLQNSKSRKLSANATPQRKHSDAPRSILKSPKPLSHRATPAEEVFLCEAHKLQLSSRMLDLALRGLYAQQERRDSGERRDSADSLRRESGAANTTIALGNGSAATPPTYSTSPSCPRPMRGCSAVSATTCPQRANFSAQSTSSPAARRRAAEAKAIPPSASPPPSLNASRRPKSERPRDLSSDRVSASAAASTPTTTSRPTTTREPYGHRSEAASDPASPSAGAASAPSGADSAPLSNDTSSSDGDSPTMDPRGVPPPPLSHPRTRNSSSSRSSSVCSSPSPPPTRVIRRGPYRSTIRVATPTRDEDPRRRRKTTVAGMETRRPRTHAPPQRTRTLPGILVPQRMCVVCRKQRENAAATAATTSDFCSSPRDEAPNSAPFHRSSCSRTAPAPTCSGTASPARSPPTPSGHYTVPHTANVTPRSSLASTRSTHSVDVPPSPSQQPAVVAPLQRLARIRAAWRAAWPRVGAAAAAGGARGPTDSTTRLSSSGSSSRPTVEAERHSAPVIGRREQSRGQRRE